MRLRTLSSRAAIGPLWEAVWIKVRIGRLPTPAALEKDWSYKWLTETRAIAKMPLSVQTSRIDEIIDNHIYVWTGTPSLVPLAEVLLRDREIIANELAFAEADGSGSATGDAIRSFLLCYALERVKASIGVNHFILFKEAETVEAVLEDSFGINPGAEDDEIIVPYQKEALKIIVRSIFGRRSGPAVSKDIAAFVQLFSRIGPKVKSDQDRIMRYKTLVWLVYLVIDLVRNDREIRGSGPDIAVMKFRRLFDHIIRGEIIDEDSRKPGFEGGKWEKTLFGWLQGEDRKTFVLKLKRQFNFENKLEHANRYLLAEHRKCVFEEVMSLFS